MKLAQWLTDNSRTVEDFAAEIGVKRQTVHRYIQADRLPLPDIIDRIADATGGMVTVVDWHEGRRRSTTETAQAAA